MQVELYNLLTKKRGINFALRVGNKLGNQQQEDKMGLQQSFLKLIIRSKKKYGLAGPVLTLGNQDIYADEHDLMRWLRTEDVAFTNPQTIRRYSGTSIVLRNPKARDFIHASTFFEFLGISESDYYDVDKYDFDKPKILHDLEEPFPESFRGRFNLIIDAGTLEHIFDIKSVLVNIVSAAKPGALVLHFTPADNFLNHGFYQLSPTLFHDFYTLNGFEVLESYIVEAHKRFFRFYLYDHAADYTDMFFKSYSQLFNCVILKKLRDVEKISSPMQLKYKALKENPEALMSNVDHTMTNRRAAMKSFDL
ncbi:MAG: class I SAM-dependent methyltransferase [Nitrospirae bacterium YQR-1]